MIEEKLQGPSPDVAASVESSEYEEPEEAQAETVLLEVLNAFLG